MKEKNFIRNANKTTDFQGNTYEFECMGCSMANGTITPPGGIIYENESFIISQDPEIPISGFILINAKKHINSFIELSDEERVQLIHLLNKVIKAIKELHIAEEVTIIQEERSKHFHIWIFSYQKWMIEKFGNGISYIRNISTYAQENTSKEEKDRIIYDVNRIRDYFHKESH